MSVNCQCEHPSISYSHSSTSKIPFSIIYQSSYFLPISYIHCMSVKVVKKKKRMNNRITGFGQMGILVFQLTKSSLQKIFLNYNLKNKPHWLSYTSVHVNVHLD